MAFILLAFCKLSQPFLILLIIAGYFLVMLAISRLVSRRADNATFFTGNRRMPWPLVAVAMICAPISGVTFISVPGMVVAKGYGYLQMCLGFIVGYLVIAFVLLPVFYRHKVVSIYSYLGDRFGGSTYRTGAWMFFISKILGAAVRFLVICTILQLLVFGPVGLPFAVTVTITLALIWAYTAVAGVKAVIWTDMFKCLCLVLSIGVCIAVIISQLHFNAEDVQNVLTAHHTVHIFNFDNPAAESYFWKQFFAGIFLVVAMTGLDQDMMQHALTCRNARSSMKNMVVSSVMQFVVIAFFLFLGSLLVIYAENNSIAFPAKSDNLFGTIAFHESVPIVFSIFFVLGLVAATYSSVGSALTSLTTSFTIDICRGDKKFDSNKLASLRKIIHGSIAAVMALIIIIFYYSSDNDAISAVFTLASYTYGPILGLFAFGLFSRREVRPKLIPAVCIFAPVACLVMQWATKTYFNYEIGFELLIINALITILCLGALSVPSRQSVKIDKSTE